MTSRFRTHDGHRGRPATGTSGPARGGPRPQARTLAALATAAAVLVPVATAQARPAATPSAGSPAATGFEQQVLFKGSQEHGYACFRIPAIVRSTSGTLLAFAEGRVRNCGDAGDIDLVLKRSTDGGRTWGPLQVVNEGGGDTHGNPAPVVDRETGRVLLAETYNKGRPDAGNCDVPCDRTPHLQYSDDDGATWSAPRDLTAELRPPGWNSWYATGPVHGIQLARGRHAGRLVFTVNAESYGGGRIIANHGALMLSDDGGDSWRVGAVDSYPTAADGTFRQKPSEMSLLERSDGSVYVNGREQDGTDLGHRTAAVSHDGGESFARPFRALPGLYAPMVQGSVLRLPPRDSRGPGRTLFAAPADPDRRRTMTIRSSYDEGRTWEGVDRGARVTADWSGYSDLVSVSPGLTGLLYEGGAADARDEIRFARFTDGWLGPRRAPDPTTPDHGRHARPALVLGGARPVPGRFGDGLSFDGRDDAVRLPFRSSLPLGSGDFTCSLWFRYRATSGEQPFLWMGGVGSRSPQVALRGDPARNRVSAFVTALDGARPPATAEVASGTAYNDDRWHHLALRRTGGHLTLTVDGAETRTVPDVPGSVSRNSVFGVHAGQKPDSRSQLSGDLDEVRVYGRALDDDELARVRQDNARVRGPVVLHLPLNHVHDED
ncbi:laminin G [Streptomyces sp. CB02923]|uniref:sialidase family protein n=1 Tax=Streptomyces sp. CB02923 TaxID=1718985 RepID=UPI0009402E53|nr:sialidase family protein [Streptomyces sp. CB02923]OKI00793.1 laminin G [Streptomyces sp. CB02923]